MPVDDTLFIGPSRWLTLWMFLCVSLVGLLAGLYLPIAIASATSIATLMGGYSALRIHALRDSDNAIVAIRVLAESIEVRSTRRGWVPVKILQGGLVTPWVVVLRLTEVTEHSRWMPLVVCCDQVGAQQFRQLRVHLRWRLSDPSEHKSPYQ